jgi:branched-chain amino acid transport system ATP-binding protein
MSEIETQNSETTEQDTDTETVLSIQNLKKSFGGITAVNGVSFDVTTGQMTGLIGPNGAGKSTTFNCITNFVEPDSGSIQFDGTDITGVQTHEIAREGLVRTFQIARELEEMTVLENIMLSAQNQRETAAHAVFPGLRERVHSEETDLAERAWEQLEFFSLDHLAHEYAGALSGGQRKLLEIARATTADPEMLLLDEPFAGVNPTLEEEILDRLHQLTGQGYTFLIVEHDIDLIMENCNKIVVMHQGELLAEGPAREIKNDERVIDAYLGGEGSA